MSLIIIDITLLAGGALIFIAGYFLIRSFLRKRDPLRETIPIINSSPGDYNGAKFSDI